MIGMRAGGTCGEVLGTFILLDLGGRFMGAGKGGSLHMYGVYLEIVSLF